MKSSTNPMRAGGDIRYVGTGANWPIEVDFMFVILVYDVGEQRVTRVLKKCRQYLYWVQNSVFEGEITPGRLKRLKRELSDLIDADEDSVIIYEFGSTRYARRDVLGLEKGGQDVVL